MDKSLDLVSSQPTFRSAATQGWMSTWPILAKMLFAFGMVLVVCTLGTGFLLWQLYALMGQLAVAQDAARMFALREQLVFGITTSFWIAIGALGGGGVGIVLSSLFIKRVVVRPIAHARDVALRIAAHDLSGEVQVHSGDETGALLSALASMQGSLRTTLDQVQQISGVIMTSSSEVAEGAVDLSARTEQTTNYLQETASTLSGLTEAVHANAQSSGQASEVAGDASRVVQQGNEAVGRVVSTMGDIHAASRKIAEIIAVIDGIAFQTNILALNAAVEAARAGEQGRGFAVVATEVRNLAGRSAEAAKEIRQLITSSVEQVEVGSAQVNEAGQTMQDILRSVHTVARIVGTIQDSTRTQNHSIAALGQAVDQVDGMTQQNAALVEESAAAAASLKDQSRRLTDIVGTFRL